MDRREFLRLTAHGVAGSGLVARLPDLGCPLVRACREGARRTGLEWTAIVADRVESEAREFRMVRAVQDLLHLSDVVREFRKSGCRFAPGWGRTGSSLVAHLLGLTEVNPLKCDILFDVLRSRLYGNVPWLSLALEEEHVPAFIGALTPLYATPEPRYPDCPHAIECGLPVATVYLIPLTDRNPIKKDVPTLFGRGRLRLPKGERLAWSGFGMLCLPTPRWGILEERLQEYLDAYAPRSVSDCALALGLWDRFTCPPTPEVLAARVGRGPKGDEGPQDTYGYFVFEEDYLSAEALITQRTGADRVEVRRFLDALASGRWDEGMRGPLEEAARRQGRDQDSCFGFMQGFWLSWAGMYPKAHATALALMIHDGDSWERKCAMLAHSASYSDEAPNWPGHRDAVELARRFSPHQSFGIK